MSKSHPSSTSRILITDTAEQIRSRIQSAVTDSIPLIDHDPLRRPGISNLIDIYAGLTDTSTSHIVKRFEGKMAGDLKLELVDVLIQHLSPIQQEYNRLKEARGDIEHIFRRGALDAAAIADQTLQQVKKTVGLL